MKNEPLSLFAFDVFAPSHLTSGSWRAEGDQGLALLAEGGLLTGAAPAAP